jgi:hypothetical protein
MDNAPLAGANAYPYSRVLKGQLLSQTSRLSTRRPARNSHPSRRATGGTIRSRVLGVTGATIAPGLAACPVPAPPRLFLTIHSLAKKEKGAKRKKATTTVHLQIAPIGALNGYKGDTLWGEVTAPTRHSIRLSEHSRNINRRLTP